MDMIRGGWGMGLLGNGMGVATGGGSAYDPASDLIFANFTTPPTTQRKTDIDNCVRALKAAGVWLKLDALYVMAAADSQAARINWYNPTGAFTLVEVNAPAFTADLGYAGASTKYLDTNWNPTTAPFPNYAQNSGCIFGYTRTNQQSAQGFIGNTAGTVQLVGRNTSDFAIGRINNTTPNATVASTDSIGFWSVTRSGASAVELYKNAVSIDTDAGASVALTNGNMWVLRQTSNYFTGDVSCMGVGSHLTAAEQTALYNALNTYMIAVGAVVSYQAETEAIAAAFTTPPTTARKNLIDQAVVALKTAGIWAKLDALYLFAAADSQAAKINWKAPGTYDAAEVTAPTFTADQGFTGASTKYLNSGFNPATATTPKYVQDSAAAFAWSLTNVDVGGGILGYVTSTGLIVLPKFASSFNHTINAAASTGVGNGDSTGLYTVVRTAASAHEAYKNGASVATGVVASTAVANENIVFLRRTSGYWTGQCAAGGFGSQLSAAEQLALYNALRAYLTGVGVP